MKNKTTIYFVEGKCEEKLLNELKKEPELITLGRVQVFNVLTNRISTSKLMTFKKNVNVCFVFDSDVEQNLTIYNHNISVLKKYVSGVSLIYLLKHSYNNLVPI